MMRCPVRSRKSGSHLKLSHEHRSRPPWSTPAATPSSARSRPPMEGCMSPDRLGDEPALVPMHGSISLRAQRHPDVRRLLQAVGAHVGQIQRSSRCSPRQHHATLRACAVVEPCSPRFWPPTSPPMMAPEEPRHGSTAHPMDPVNASNPTQTSRTTRPAARGPPALG